MDVPYPPETRELPVFAKVDHSQIAKHFGSSERESLAFSISRLLIVLYEEEWHYHLMVPKKGKGNRGLRYPTRRKDPAAMPLTNKELRSFLREEPFCNTIKRLENTEKIGTPGKWYWGNLFLPLYTHF